jgi:hypothetical protein
MAIEAREKAQNLKREEDKEQERRERDARLEKEKKG